MLTAAALSAALAAHAPVVVHDSRERFTVTSVAAAPVAAADLDRDRRPAVYGRVAAAAGGGAWLQYWLFYSAQDQDRGILRTGRHAGDWEMVQYRIDGRGRPVDAVYAQHSGAERCAWQRVQQRDGRPVVYAARGSHASYLRPGTRDRTWPDPNDEADGEGVVLRPRLVRVSADSPSWMRWPRVGAAPARAGGFRASRTRRAVPPSRRRGAGATLTAGPTRLAAAVPAATRSANATGVSSWSAAVSRSAPCSDSGGCAAVGVPAAREVLHAAGSARRAGRFVERHVPEGELVATGRNKRAAHRRA